MSLSDWKHKVKTWLITDNRWKMVEVYAEWPNALADALEAEAWSRVPKGSGWEAPVAQTVEITEDHATGKGILIVSYRSPTWWEYAEKNPSKGVLLTRTSSQKETVKFDKDGVNKIGLDTSDLLGRTKWEIDDASVGAGSQTSFKPISFQIVRAIVSSRTTSGCGNSASSVWAGAGRSGASSLRGSGSKGRSSSGGGGSSGTTCCLKRVFLIQSMTMRASSLSGRSWRSCAVLGPPQCQWAPRRA